MITVAHLPSVCRRIVPAVVLMLVMLSGCASPQINFPGKPVKPAVFLDDWFVATDGIRLTTRRWAPTSEKPKAILVALHGFNDYSNFFHAPGTWLADRGILSYAYDQRGFGDGPDRGLWAGNKAYAGDLADFVDVVRRRHPGFPVYVLGESFGGAVAMVAATGVRPPQADGIILAAPAVWGRAAMTWYERAALWLTAHTVPWMRVSGQGLNIKPSDNIEMLRGLGRDWRVIKRTRVETLHGLVGMMDAALASAPKFDANALILYGEKDEIIPGKPTFDMVRRLPVKAKDRQTFALYPGGYHMLLRDLNADAVWRDILSWIDNSAASLPSGAVQRARDALADKE